MKSIKKGNNPATFTFQMLIPSKLTIARWQERYVLINTKTHFENELARRETPWKVNSEGEQNWKNKAYQILDREGGTYDEKQREVEKMVKKYHLDLVSWIQDANLAYGGPEARGAGMWGHLYIERGAGVDLDFNILEGSDQSRTHINLITRISKKSIINMLSSRIPRDQQNTGYFSKSEMDNIATTLPLFNRIKEMDVKKRIKTLAWGGEVTKGGFKIRTWALESLAIRMNLQTKVVKDLEWVFDNLHVFREVEEILDFIFRDKKQREYNLTPEFVRELICKILRTM